MPHQDSNEQVLSRSEWTVMNAVWKTCEASRDTTVGELMDSMPNKKKWNVSTVKTMLERLAKKGVLTSTVRGRTCFYAPAVGRDAVVKSNVSMFLDNALEGAFGPLVAYLADRQKLDEKEIATLEKMLESSKKKRP